MTIRSELDIENLKTRVGALERHIGVGVKADAEQVVTVARKHWDAVIQRLEALEAKVRKK
jgi:BMFP domain-containing protein YqiC